jgi:hypothetical protein
MVSNSQLRDSAAPGGNQIDPYEMGKIVAQQSHLTAAVHDLAKAVQRQTDAVFGIQRDMSELKDGLKHANSDIRVLAEKAVTMDAVDARLRSVGIDPMDAAKHRANQEFLTRRRHTIEEQNSTKRHARNAVAAAVAVALMWWMWEGVVLPQIGATVQKAQQHDTK